MGLVARIFQYGFYLALPATVGAVVLICWLIPRRLDARTAGVGRSFRQIAVWALVAAIAPYLGLSHGWYRTKVLRVGSGGDQFFASAGDRLWHGAAIRSAHERLEDAAAPNSTLAVLPEGIMLNYLLRRESPLRVVNFMPPELMAFGEESVLRSLETTRPDFVVLVHRNTREYAYPLFGTDPRYGLRIVRWVKANYRTIEVIGKEPLKESGFGMEILQRSFKGLQ
jgi:hypothetical protein